MAAFWVLALRSPKNGIDLVGYCPMFERIARVSLVESFKMKVLNYEQGFVVYNKLVSLIGDDIQLYLAVTAFISIGLVSWVIYKYSPNIFLSFIIFLSFGLYAMCFSGLRQSLAFCLTFLSFHFLVKGDFLKFIALVLLASTMHTSAIIFIFTWFVRNKRMSLSLGLSILGIYTILCIPLFHVIAAFIIPLLFGEKYGSYNNVGEGGAITMALVYAIIFISSYLIKLKETNLLQLLRWMILFSVMFQSLGFISTGALTRIAYYFNIFYCLFIPVVLSNFPRGSKGVWYGITAVLFIIFFGLTMSTGYLNIVPYHFYWEIGWENPEYFVF